MNFGQIAAIEALQREASKLHSYIAGADTRMEDLTPLERVTVEAIPALEALLKEREQWEKATWNLNHVLSEIKISARGSCRDMIDAAQSRLPL